MTDNAAKTFEALVHSWATIAGRQTSCVTKRVGSAHGYTCCGTFAIHHRTYEITAPGGPLKLSVFGMRVFATQPRFHGQASWLFRGLTAEEAYGRFLDRVRPYLEPRGDLL